MKFYDLNQFFKVLSYEEVVSFGKGQRNRKVKLNHVNDFINVIKNGKSRKYLDEEVYLVFGLIPVIINPVTGHIMEGQHRLQAFIDAHNKGMIDDNARILIVYWDIYDEELENTLIIDLNSNSKNWSIDDYMNNYSQYLEYYQKLKEFCENHELCMTYGKKGEKTHKYRYAAAMIKGMSQASVLKKGAFTCTDEELKQADIIHKELCEIRKKLNLPMVGTDIEAMAIVWHTDRNLISVSDIKSIYYFNKDIEKKLADIKNIKNKKDWDYIFSKFEKIVNTKNLKKVA